MGKTRQRIYQIIITIVILILAISMSGCTGSTGKDDTHLLSGLNDRVVEIVLENDEARDVITASDVVINQMFYGSFSGPETEEVLVACRMLNMPHVGGLGRMAIIILEVDSMNVVAYDEIPADEVWVSSLPMSNGQDRIIFSGKSTYQGISSQDIMYFGVQNGQWMEIPAEEFAALGENCFYFLTGDVMIAASQSELTDISEITAIFRWNQEAGKFILEQPSENIIKEE